MIEKINVLEFLEDLRDEVDMEDIPHPTIPEYKEHHESIQRILKSIDLLIEKVNKL